MAKFKDFLRAGHPPTLFAAFLYFDFCFAVWVLNGAMAPFISEEFNLSPAQKGFMISVPIIAGALMRFPLGVLAQYIGRKSAALVEMGMVTAALAYGYFFVHVYNDVLIMGILLGIAGASFGVALSLGSGWFPPKHKGLAMGIAGAGNSGTVLAVLLAPPLATAYGWRAVYGLAALVMLVPVFVMILFAKEPPDREHQTLKEHLGCLVEKDGWAFNFIYIITFGGFIGLSNFLPTYFYDQFGVTKIQAGQLTMFAALMGSGIRVVGGYVSDRWGGIRTLMAVFGVVIVSILLSGAQASAVSATILFMFCFAALGAGNGALFQLVPLRWPTTTAVAGSMIGEIGALGGGFIPNAMGLSKQWTGTYYNGFVAFAALATVAFVVLYVAQRKWTKVWVGEGGKARDTRSPPVLVETVSTAPAGGALPAFKTLVYPVGNSELMEKSRGLVTKLCKMSGARLVLVYVDDKFHGATAVMTPSEGWGRVRENWLEEGKAMLRGEAEEFRKMNVANIETELRRGHVATEVVNCAHDRQADMIILASHKPSPLGTLLMGERTYDVFRQAKCPILRIVR
ncbi:MAG: MFS transporter [Bdellovibrionales bacterium]|nr:MFS transporter [Bdellovibrionales bacterium]